MFYNCSSLEKLNINNFDTSKVRDMSYMFYNCCILTCLNLSNFNTKKTINMSNMFYKCLELIELDISKLDIKNETRIKFMFSYCPLELQNKIKNKIKNINNDAFDESKEKIHPKFDFSKFFTCCWDYHSYEPEPYNADDFDDENL